MKSDFKAVWTRADAKLKYLVPAVQQLCVSELELPSDECNPIFCQLFDTLIKGVELLKKCENTSPLNPFLRYRYTLQILRLEQEIQGFMDLMPAYLVLEYRRQKQELQGYYDALQPADPSSTLNESICRQASLPTDNASLNAMLLQQMRIDQFCDHCEMDEGFYHSGHDLLPVKSQLFVGLERSIRDLKRLLFQNEVSIVGVQCTGGGGKTTLALALRDDDDVKGYFQNVAFVSVSQSPNLKVIIETMWDKLVGIKSPKFKNVEDAHMQLQQQLLLGSGSTLVILDDVWCRESLEKLVFEGPGLKTLVTTRYSSTIPRNHFTRLYQLPLLGHEDALSLFSFWAFGQPSIPTNADANLVKEGCEDCGEAEPRDAQPSDENQRRGGEPWEQHFREKNNAFRLCSYSASDDSDEGCSC